MSDSTKKLPTLKKVKVPEIKYHVGDSRNGHEVLSSANRKKILLLSDDLRMSSGVGTMSREFVHGTVHKYDWVQVGAAIKHPEKGKVFNLDTAVREYTGVEDARVTVYPCDGYGDPDMLRALMAREKPDAIMIYTDPRFWVWLFGMEHEIRQLIPIMYYNIWDDFPPPLWNASFYESCDLIMNISKQTHSLVNAVLKHETKVNIINLGFGDDSNLIVDPPGNGSDGRLSYVPHGINEEEFHPIAESDADYAELVEFRKKLFGVDDPEFVVFWNNRNIRRKMTSDVILAYREFCDNLPKEKSDKCVLVLKTQPVDPNGTDLPEVIKHNCPYRVVFHTDRVPAKGMNFLYNVADVTVNIASNEGFGLSGAESMMAGTPIVNNVTGGLQDHCGFKLNGQYLTYVDYLEIGTLHDHRLWKNNPDLSWGEWAIPVWPAQRALMGSPQTPYIFDDRADWIDVSDAFMQWYEMGASERDRLGLLGREYACRPQTGFGSSEMASRFIQSMDVTFDTWKPRKRFEICEGGLV